MQTIKTVAQIVRQFDINYKGMTGTYPVGIGKFDNGNYYVVRTSPPSFLVDESNLFDALDKAYEIVEDYHKSILDRLPLSIIESHKSKPLFVTRVAAPESNVKPPYVAPECKHHECNFCGRIKEMPCMNTRDCEDNTSDICQAALLVAGGGEYTWRQKISTSLFNTNQLPHADDFKTQIKIGNRSFVNLANKLLRKEKHSL